MQHITEAAFNHIRSFESLALESYPDDGYRIWTIGYGHTMGVREGDCCSEEQAERWLYSDVSEFERLVTRAVHVPLTQGQYDALVCWAYNCKSWSTSTLIKLVNQGSFTAAAAEFERWVYANGKRLNGLIRRRKAERAMFERTEQLKKAA